MSRNTFLVLSAVLLTAGFLFAANLLCDEPPAAILPALAPIATDPPVPAGKTSAEDLIRQALAKPVSLRFVETPFEDVVKTLQEKLHINIILDIRPLLELGVGDDTPITFSVANIPCNDALALILHDLGLTTVIRRKVLLITTPEQADSMLETRVYDVADLVRQIGLKDAQPNFDNLIEAITTCLQPTSWDEVGGVGSIAPFQAVGIDVLIIGQTYDVHEQVTNLLANLRAMRRNGNKHETAAVGPAIKPPQPENAAARTSPFTPQEEKIRHALFCSNSAAIQRNAARENRRIHP